MNSATTLHPKVASATIAGSLTALVVYLLQQYAGTDIPPTVAAALTTLFTFIGGYIAPVMHDMVPPALSLPTEPPLDDSTEPQTTQSPKKAITTGASE